MLWQRASGWRLFLLWMMWCRKMNQWFARLAAVTLCFVTVNSAQASTKTIGRIQSDALRVLVVESDEGLSLALRSDSILTREQARVQFVSKPDRVIIDLPNIKRSLATDKMTFNRHPLVKGIRIGAHPDKTRVVLDLHSIPRSHSVSSVDELGALLVHLSFDGSIDGSFNESTTKAANTSNTKSFAITKLSDQELQQKALEAEKLEKLNTQRQLAAAATRSRLARAGAYLGKSGIIIHRGQAATEESAKEELPRKGTISAIATRKSDSSELDSLTLEVSGIEEFSLEPAQGNIFILRLANTSNQAALANISGIGFESISLSDDAPDTIVEIKVKSGVTLAPLMTPDTLVLRATRH